MSPEREIPQPDSSIEEKGQSDFGVYTEAELKGTSVEDLKSRAQLLRGLKDDAHENAKDLPRDPVSREANRDKYRKLEDDFRIEIKRIERELLSRPQ